MDIYKGGDERTSLHKKKVCREKKTRTCVCVSFLVNLRIFFAGRQTRTRRHLVKELVRELLRDYDGGVHQQGEGGQRVQVANGVQYLPRKPKEQQAEDEVGREVGGVATEEILLASAVGTKRRVCCEDSTKGN